jgi:biopolymer transport protein ExbD
VAKSRLKKLHGARLRAEANKPFYLNLTAMVDMFTIMLVFLLLTASVNDVAFTPPANVQLPTSRSERIPTLLVKVAISPTAISVEDRDIVSLEAGRVREEDSQGLVIFPLYRELKAIADAQSAQEKAIPDKKIDRRVVLYGDKSIPFATLKRVLFTAGQAEFEGFRFSVIRRGGAF